MSEEMPVGENGSLFEGFTEEQRTQISQDVAARSFMSELTGAPIKAIIIANIDKEYNKSLLSECFQKSIFVHDTDYVHTISFILGEFSFQNITGFTAFDKAGYMKYLNWPKDSAGLIQSMKMLMCSELGPIVYDSFCRGTFSDEIRFKPIVGILERLGSLIGVDQDNKHKWHDVAMCTTKRVINDCMAEIKILADFLYNNRFLYIENGDEEVLKKVYGYKPITDQIMSIWDEEVEKIYGKDIPSYL